MDRERFETLSELLTDEGHKRIADCGPVGCIEAAQALERAACHVAAGWLTGDYFPRSLLEYGDGLPVAGTACCAVGALRWALAESQPDRTLLDVLDDEAVGRIVVAGLYPLLRPYLRWYESEPDLTAWNDRDGTGASLVAATFGEAADFLRTYAARHYAVTLPRVEAVAYVC